MRRAVTMYYLVLLAESTPRTVPVYSIQYGVPLEFLLVYHMARSDWSELIIHTLYYDISNTGVYIDPSGPFY